MLLWNLFCSSGKKTISHFPNFIGNCFRFFFLEYILFHLIYKQINVFCIRLKKGFFNNFKLLLQFKVWQENLRKNEKLNLIIIKQTKQTLSILYIFQKLCILISITYSNLKSSAKRITYHSNKIFSRVGLRSFSLNFLY